MLCGIIAQKGIKSTVIYLLLVEEEYPKGGGGEYKIML